MDVASLLYGYRPATAQDRDRKALVLEQTFAHLNRNDAALTADAFLAELPPQLLSHVFGNDAEDSFATGMMAAASRHIANLDVFAAMAMNAVAVEMNFQTRLAIDGVFGPSEAIVYAGDRAMFPLVMAQGNQTVGMLLSDDTRMFEVPDWLERAIPASAIKPEHLFERPLGDIAPALQGFGRTRIGAVMLVPDAGTPSPDAAFAALGEIADLVTRHTIYSVVMSAEATVAAARDLQDRYPEADIKLRLYSVAAQGGLEYRGILVGSNFPEFPLSGVSGKVSRASVFGDAIDQAGVLAAGVEVLDFPRTQNDVPDRAAGPAPGKPRGRFEPLTIKSPIAISSSAPLPLEARAKLSDGYTLYHSTIGMKGGMILQTPTEKAEVYLHATSDARIILDYGDEHGHLKTAEPYLAAVEQPDGTRVGELSGFRLVRIKGAAIPLAFSPFVTHWHSHFLIQCLPRIRIAQDLGYAATILTPPGLRKKQLEMLHVLGIPYDKIVEIVPGTIVQADTLIVPNAWTLAFGAYHSAIYSRFVTHFDCDPKAPPRRLLISRASRTSWRNMLNYEAVKTLLVERYGFEVVMAETLTLEEEVRLYNSAEIVVGAEGAGMYGAVFARPNSVYISLCDEDYVMPIMATLASVIGFEIAYVFGESRRAGADLKRRLPYGHADFIIDPMRVIDVLETAIRKVNATREATGA